MKYNFREKFAGFKQVPRRYIPDDEGGLIICTWPHGGRPKPFILYADEVWTGIEYAAAGRDGLRRARSTRPGGSCAWPAAATTAARRDGLNSGPGGNPFNELECGKFYARAMSSWSLLIASQGLVLEGPKGILGFKPNWQPEDHRSLLHRAGGLGAVRPAAQAGAADRADRGPPRPVAAQGARFRNARSRGGDGHGDLGRPARGRHVAADGYRCAVGARAGSRGPGRRRGRSRSALAGVSVSHTNPKRKRGLGKMLPVLVLAHASG